jgi:hypothetical protein
MARMDMSHELGYGEDGQLVRVVDFDYEQLDHALADKELNKLSPQQTEMLMTMFRAVMQWWWQDGMKNPDGLLIRGTILSWVFLPELQSHSLTQVARNLGRYKQSVGRWFDRFKVQFPQIRTVHMKNRAQRRA